MSTAFRGIPSRLAPQLCELRQGIDTKVRCDVVGHVCVLGAQSAASTHSYPWRSSTNSILDLLKGYLSELGDDGLHISIEIDAGHLCDESSMLLKRLSTED